MNRVLMEILKSDPAYSAVDIKMLVGYAKRWNCTLYEAALDCHFMTETELADLIARSMQMDRVYNLTLKNVQTHALEALSYQDAKKLVCYPLTYMDGEKGRLEVVVADPTQSGRLEEIRKKVNAEVIFAVAERRHVMAAIDENYPLEDQLGYR